MSRIICLALLIMAMGCASKNNNMENIHHFEVNSNASEHTPQDSTNLIKVYEATPAQNVKSFYLPKSLLG